MCRNTLPCCVKADGKERLLFWNTNVLIKIILQNLHFDKYPKADSFCVLVGGSIFFYFMNLVIISRHVVGKC